MTPEAHNKNSLKYLDKPIIVSSMPTALLEEVALGDHILFYLSALLGPWMGSAMTEPGPWGHNPVSLEILRENTERVRGGGARRKTVRMREQGQRGQSEPEKNGEHEEK